jgi:sortase A
MDETDAVVRSGPGVNGPDTTDTEPVDRGMDFEAVQRLRPPTRRAGIVLRIVRGVGWTSITLGLLILGFVAHQLWVTTWFAQQQQGALSEEREAYFDDADVSEVVFTGPGAPEPVRDPATGELVTPTLLVETPPEESTAFALIRIPKIERLQEGWNVVEGVRLSDLKNGAGHMPQTPLPGQPGNAVISGHRTTYGQPFHELDLLEADDRILVETAIGTHTYAVREVFVVQPTELSVIENRDGAWLTLTTCNPKFSARERLIVQAELIAGPNADVILGST